MVFKAVTPVPAAEMHKKLVAMAKEQDRDVYEVERQNIRKAGVHAFTMRDIDERGMRAVMEEALRLVGRNTVGYHVSLDLDWIDPEDARAFQLMLLPLGRRRAVRVVGILDRMQRQFEETIGAVKLEAMLEQMDAVEELCSRMAQSAR